LNRFCSEITEDNIQLYISTLERDELRAHAAYKVSKIDAGEVTTTREDLFSDASKIAESEAELASQFDLIYESNNTYVPPVVYDILPANTERYFIINGQYICGGFFPPFLRWDENLVSTENYTRNNLVELAGMLAILISSSDTNYQIYEKIKNFIDEKESSPNIDINLVRNRFEPEPITTSYEYLKIPVKTIMYTIRSRYGVQLPGEVYNVILDNTNVYGVPFKFQNEIPVYSMKLKKLVEDRFVIIEGPSLYEETSEINFLRSNYYILIEYVDPRGLKIFFREGVSDKKIIKKAPGYSACDRFKNRVACDDPNSYSLEIKGKRYKCIWKEKCVFLDNSKFLGDVKDFELNKVQFSESYKQNDWVSALEKSLKYIEDKILSEKLSYEDIEILKKNQKMKLYNYYIELLNHSFPKEIGKTSITSVSDVVHDKSLLDEFQDILKPDLPLAKNVPTIEEGYVQYTLYKHKKSTSVKNVDPIILNSTYSTYIDGTYVDIEPFEFIQSKKSYKCKLKNYSIIEVSKNEIYDVVKNILTVVPIYCIVKKEDLQFLTERLGYYWIHLEKLSNRRYDQNGEPEIVTMENEVKRYDVPTNFIEPTINLTGQPIITRDNIFEAMYKTAFNTLTNSINSLIYTTKFHFDATLEAKKFAVINRIDLKKIIKIGTIGIEDIQKMPGIDYSIRTITPGQILEIIKNAISEKNIDVLSEYYLMAIKAEIDKTIIAEAKSIIDSYKKRVVEDISKPIDISTPEETKSIVSYVIQRPGKQREIKEE
jgi:hypothetical protein